MRETTCAKVAASLTEEERIASIRFNIAASTQHPVPEQLNGRGIIICAGGRYLPSAWVCITRLRQLGCNLSIELWHLEGEISASWMSAFGPLNVNLVEATVKLAQQPSQPAGAWELKVFAIVFSRYQEALLLDADNVAVEDPTHLFDEPEYLKYGSVFWWDSHRMMKDDRIWDICGIQRRDEPELESGQLLVNKSACWQELMLTLYMNEHSDFFYRYLYGDKDTFRFAWHKRGKAFATPALPPHKSWAGTICQPGLTGRRLFQHRTRKKWSLDRNYGQPDFWFEEECMRSIEELRKLLGPTPNNRDGRRIRRSVRVSR